MADTKKLSALAFAVIVVGLVLISTTATRRPNDTGTTGPLPAKPQSPQQSATHIPAYREPDSESVPVAPVAEPTAEPVAVESPHAAAEANPIEEPENWVFTLYPELARILELENQPASVAVSGLVPMLSDTDPVVRLAALESLADLDRQAPLTAVTAALADPDPQIRTAALDALAMRRDPLAAGSIETLVYDPDMRVRTAAIDALAAIGDRSSVHTLGALLGDPEPLVRRVAVGALGEIGGKIAIGYLRQLRYDPDESIRASANAILREEALGAD